MNSDTAENMKIGTNGKSGYDFEFIGSAIKDSAIFLIAAAISSIGIFNQYLEFPDAKKFYISVSIFLGLTAIIITKRPKSQEVSIILFVSIVISLVSAILYLNNIKDYLIDIHDDFGRFLETFLIYLIVGLISLGSFGFISSRIKDRFESRQWLKSK